MKLQTMTFRLLKEHNRPRPYPKLRASNVCKLKTTYMLNNRDRKEYSKLGLIR